MSMKQLGSNIFASLPLIWVKFESGGEISFSLLFAAKLLSFPITSPRTRRAKLTYWHRRRGHLRDPNWID